MSPGSDGSGEDKGSPRLRPALRIGYIGHVNGATSSGVALKLDAQMRAWRAAGHHVELHVLTRDTAADWSGVAGARTYRYEGPRSRVAALNHLIRGIRTMRPDLVYLRWDLVYPQFLAIPRSARLVVEINSDDLREYRLGSRLRYAYHRGTRPLLLRRAAALVFVTAELRDSRSFRRLPGVREVIANGIDLASYPELPLPAPSARTLTFVGSAGQPWQGVDKVVDLARRRPAWRFHIVGMATPDGSPDNMEWHGALPKQDVIRILALAHVGIGTLALHRKHMQEACPLKVREYLAVGLPVICAYRDPDIPAAAPYALDLPNQEDALDRSMERIDEFVEDPRLGRVPRSAIEHLDTSAKEARRLDLFARVVGD